MQLKNMFFFFVELSAPEALGLAVYIHSEIYTKVTIYYFRKSQYVQLIVLLNTH